MAEDFFCPFVNRECNENCVILFEDECLIKLFLIKNVYPEPGISDNYDTNNHKNNGINYNDEDEMEEYEDYNEDVYLTASKIIKYCRDNNYIPNKNNYKALDLIEIYIKNNDIKGIIKTTKNIIADIIDRKNVLNEISMEELFAIDDQVIAKQYLDFIIKETIPNKIIRKVSIYTIGRFWNSMNFPQLDKENEKHIEKSNKIEDIFQTLLEEYNSGIINKTLEKNKEKIFSYFDEYINFMKNNKINNVTKKDIKGFFYKKGIKANDEILNLFFIKAKEKSLLMK
jgi:hypothetical protein